MKIKKTLFFPILILFILGKIAASCGDSGKDRGEIHYHPSDPSKPVTFANYNPKKGAVRTRVFIEGSNFGTDPEKIKVTVGGKEAKVIGSNDSRCYFMVPPRAVDGDVRVSILGADNEPLAVHEFDTLFNFQLTTTVSTLTGKIDPSNPNQKNMVDGSFEEAEFNEPWWIEFDRAPNGEEMLYVVEPKKALRRISLAKEDVSTVFTNGQGGFRNMQTMCFDTTRDTMFFADDNGSTQKNLPVIFYSIRGESFRKVYSYIYERTGYSCASTPAGELFFNTYFSSGILKARGQYNNDTKQWEAKQLFNIINNSNSHTYIIMHPEGLYAYLVGFNCINKSMYNKDTKELMPPVVLAGQERSSGYVDAPGTGARFGGTIRQGVFVKNEAYVKAGEEDVYDFYLCDLSNHCIRLITPKGQVSTFAGRGSYTVNNQVHGWIDGDIRKDARFNEPSGICYDEKNAIFYIADKNNRRIRYISIE